MEPDLQVETTSIYRDHLCLEFLIPCPMCAYALRRSDLHPGLGLAPHGQPVQWHSPSGTHSSRARSAKDDGCSWVDH